MGLCFALRSLFSPFWRLHLHFRFDFCTLCSFLHCTTSQPSLQQSSSPPLLRSRVMILYSTFVALESCHPCSYLSTVFLYTLCSLPVCLLHICVSVVRITPSCYRIIHLRLRTCAKSIMVYSYITMRSRSVKKKKRFKMKAPPGEKGDEREKGGRTVWLVAERRRSCTV